MKIEFTKEELDYLAWKITENLKESEAVDFLNRRAMAGVKMKDLTLSNRLRSVLWHAEMLDMTLREVADLGAENIVKIRNMGKVSFLELSTLIGYAGINFPHEGLKKFGQTFI